MRRTIVLTGTTILSLGVTAASASAGIDSGQGTLGENNDLLVTLYGFAAIVGIPAFAGIASLIQWRLDKRKYARQAAAKSRAATRDRRLGW
jgi:hypothetical protein